jgi:hypothetical protein
MITISTLSSSKAVNLKVIKGTPLAGILGLNDDATRIRRRASPLTLTTSGRRTGDSRSVLQRCESSRPATAVNVDGDREWARATGHPEFAELQRIRAVGARNCVARLGKVSASAGRGPGRAIEAQRAALAGRRELVTQAEHRLYWHRKLAPRSWWFRRSGAVSASASRH